MIAISKTRHLTCLFVVSAFFIVFFACCFCQVLAANQEKAQTLRLPFHRITVVDEETGRGIPCVELKTTDSRLFYTDSAGVVAFYEPDLMGKMVFFHIKSFGYSYPKNIFGQTGRAFHMAPGASTVIKMHRENIAQRLYRVTGSGIYRDSQLLGDQVPPTQDVSELPATGMDSVLATPYRGKMFWVWGDTSVSSNPLGNFRATAATSELVSQGGLDPDKGVYLTYFRKRARVKPMVNDKHQPIWLSALRVTRDESGRERLFAQYAKIIKGMKTKEKGLVEYNDQTQEFNIVSVYPDDAVIVPGGHPFRYKQKDAEYFYYSAPWPAVRSRTDVSSVKDLSAYEAFTCLKEGSCFDGSAEQLDRDENGNLVWSWKKNTSPINENQMNKLTRQGHIKQDETWYRLLDVNTGKPIASHAGSVYWNEYRQRWISVRSQIFGASFLGEIWYFEGDTPLGPWVYGQKVLTHAIREKDLDEADKTDKPTETYSFYNPLHHPQFDKDGGRVIYFEGTYTKTFSGSTFATPGYDYNQIMYKLELDDPRLFLPVPVYQVDGDLPVYRTKANIPGQNTNITIAFFAPDRPREGTISVREVRAEKDQPVKLVATKEISEPREYPVVFYGVDASADISATSPLSITVNLYEFVHPSGERIYTTQQSLDRPGFEKSDKPLCRVWPNPIRFNPYRLMGK